MSSAVQAGAVLEGRAPAGDRPARRRRRRRSERVGWLFILPATAHLLLFALVPIGFSLYLSFHEWTSPSFLGAPFVGFDNYISLFSDDPFWHAMWNTAYYTVLSVPIGMAVSLALAVVVNQKLRGMNVFRAVFFMPVITSWVAVSVIWITLLSPDAGLVNYLFDVLHLPAQNWLDDPHAAMFAIVLINTWKTAGFSMVIWLAGLQAVPRELLEAASIDGAGKWRQFRSVTLPLLAPTTIFLVITGVIGGFQVFTPMYVITEGGPLGSTDVAVYHIYQRAFEEFSMGYASAQAWVLFAVIFVVTLIQLWFIRRRGESNLI
ncbi:carbohydrate ABC transporter membrane protein 1 (CUT1 family) [Asanoa ferruginea]|uniref:Carbohydrate ABC transporter membrane protein 1 (CUT1 family) n=1 Tax=Asanoa ferruginea TaxID=53367 RepID=A0A3E0A1D8_9ACTN|nr:sugar ABC transporter permease [Asanoa ferruginea]REG00061.1 carbohydrate ABC transporter membrane protein 1 (CUT1 family) [Asanoa ferruginea]GIF46247.1 sugar ABC transporter permease [Asanoa ferruginea]